LRAFLKGIPAIVIATAMVGAATIEIAAAIEIAATQGTKPAVAGYGPVGREAGRLCAFADAALRSTP
jgi:hypothetical protein